MYPETDEPLVVVSRACLEQVEGSLSALPEEKMEGFMSMGLSKELATQLVKSRWVPRFEDFVKKFPEVRPSIIATMLISMPKEVRKRFDVDIERASGREIRRHIVLPERKKDIKGCSS